MGVLGWSLFVPELLPSETIAISRAGRTEKSRDLPSFLSSHLPHFFFLLSTNTMKVQSGVTQVLRIALFLLSGSQLGAAPRRWGEHSR